MSRAVYALWHRELVRFLGDRARVVGSLGQPIVFFLLFAGALRDSLRVGTQTYGEFFFPGTLAMIVMFTAIFATITVIEDRREGFLQGVLVAPVPRAAIAFGKVAGGATLGALLGAVFLLGGFAFGFVPFSFAALAGGLAVLVVLAIALTACGFALAWCLDSTAGYHGVMMLVLMPALLLSGAFFPRTGAHGIVRALMTVDPLTYGVGLLRHALGNVDPAAGVPAADVCLSVTLAFAAASLALAVAVTVRRSARDAV
ncbi:MAG TPA: ABC transporter permease [Planctomycetota bacterium]|nr:ABC transporter permease [Planctomycetota bacterium]